MTALTGSFDASVIFNLCSLPNTVAVFISSMLSLSILGPFKIFWKKLFKILVCVTKDMYSFNDVCGYQTKGSEASNTLRLQMQREFSLLRD